MQTLVETALGVKPPRSACRYLSGTRARFSSGPGGSNLTLRAGRGGRGQVARTRCMVSARSAAGGGERGRVRP